MKGVRPSESPLRWAVVPDSVGLLWVGLQYLRYRLVYGGHWTVEVRQKDLRGSEFTFTVANRPEAFRVAGLLLDEMTQLGAGDVPSLVAKLATAASGFESDQEGLLPSLDDLDEDEIYETPEKAALSDYPVGSHARVVAVRYQYGGNAAVVEITTDPEYPYYIHVERKSAGWIQTLGHN